MNSMNNMSDKTETEKSKIGSPLNTKLLDTAIVQIANAVCPHLPKGYNVHLCLEGGAGWVELHKGTEEIILPYSRGKSLSEELNDALRVSNLRKTI